MLSRAWIYHLIPVANFDDWVFRDTVMNVPRLLGFALIIFMPWYRIGIQSLFSFNGWNRNITLVTIAVTALALSRSIFFDYVPQAPEVFIVLLFSSVAVGLFEETLFRGIIFESVQQLKGTKVAIVASAILFMVFHMQAQSIMQFPLFFAFGLLFGILRSKGTSLLFLVFIHSIYDILVLFWNIDYESRTAWLSYECFVIISLCLVISLLYKNRISQVDSIGKKPLW